ncbi:MAG TPA: GNAT family N-acetyltransferase [Acidimicrobiales bacterium]
MEIRHMGPDDQGRVTQAEFLFDGPALTTATRQFLNDARHHLLIAYDESEPVGFVTGVEMTHPDKGTEMFLYELEVKESYQRKGIGTMLVARLEVLARERGCYGMWVLTSDDNAAALATYKSAGGTGETGQSVMTWDFTTIREPKGSGTTRDL